MIWRVFSANTWRKSFCEMLSLACWNLYIQLDFCSMQKGKRCSEMINAMGEKCLQIWMKGKCWWRLELQKHSQAAVLTENKVFLCVDSQVWQNVLSLVSRIQDGVTFSPSWTVLYKTSMISTCCLKKPRSKLSEKLWSRSAGDSVLSSRCCGL